jgi:uncharacterized protein (TIGR01777 family)
MRFVLPGGSGQVGQLLARAFRAEGHDVVVLARSLARGLAPVPSAGRVAAWDGDTLGPWAAEIDGADVVINLAGRSVNCRYTPANRAAMLDSRVRSTRIVGEAIAQAARPPALWIQASTATIYAHTFGAAHDEHGTLGGGEPGVPDTWRFSIEVATAWEQALEAAATPRTRRIALRSAMTMSADRGGVFDTLLGLVRRGLGGTSGDGRQYVSWVHHEDFTRAIRWLIAHEDVAGAVNVCAPEPLPNAAFMRALRDAWGTRIGLPATAWMLELGAVVLRTETELILKSRRVVPGLLLQRGFEFRFADWPSAARELVQAWRSGRSA